MIYSSYRETLLRHFLLDLDPSIYVVPLYDIVGGGVICSRVESGFARFARLTTMTDFD